MRWPRPRTSSGTTSSTSWMRGGPPGDKELRRFLDFFGQSNRITRQASTKGSVVQASMMMNSDVVKRKTLASTEGSRVSELLSKTPALPNEKIVEELFLATLSRYPTEQEMATGVSHVAMHRDKGVEDLQWALLNKLEFMVKLLAAGRSDTCRRISPD